MLSRVTGARVILPASVAAGIAPVGLVVIVDIAVGPIADSFYGWSALLGPPLVALGFARLLGVRALWVVLGGFLVELLIVAAVAALLSTADWN